ncbi:virulence factor BrkB family protein [Alteromonas sp. a30]|uniref:virulence factor BrkB family protein n=1 Tax=Alteromonas sp. a30 TaxID=2730917 RepID=UPI002281BF1A|nr:virulence factor BrkB family protein [Alteromonas sp. a30]MCY7296795.1 virulence factor BrkB family protein [Alteromonas sp. a30]
MAADKTQQEKGSKWRALFLIFTNKSLLRHIVTGCLKQIVNDRIGVTAGHLAYVTLLSLVPFVMVFFAILSAFPAFSGIRGQLEAFVFSNFVPAASDVVQKYLTEFVGNASEMGVISILFLVAVALLLISNIDKALNHLWRTVNQRRAIFTFSIYWMVLTLGPLLVGSSLAISSYLVGLKTFADEYTPGLGSLFLNLTPFIISFFIHFVLYMVVPNKSVKASHAMVGAFCAAVLFELGKKLFALYVTGFPSYQVIYGALAAVPILLLWVYVSWNIVLFGAIVTIQVGKNMEKENEKEENSVTDLDDA